MYDAIIDAATNHRLDIVKTIQENLTKELKELDEFFVTFLAKNKLDRRKKTVDNWSLYREKTEEYSLVADNLKMANYYLEKYNV